MVWATTADVKETVGVGVDDITRRVAAQSIEMLTGLIEAVDRPDMSDRNRDWLKLAVCYQAAWLASQPDFLERNDLSSATQDGQAASGANKEWLLLAPNARRCIKRLDWRGPRGLVVAARPGQGHRNGGIAEGALVSEEPWEERQGWKPF